MGEAVQRAGPAGAGAGGARMPAPAAPVMPAAPAPATAAPVMPTPAGSGAPRRTAGLELLGEYQGSGFTQPRYLVRRGDGQMIQVSELLYLILAAADGSRDLDGIATQVAARYGREVTAGNVAYLLANRLEPLGVVATRAARAGDRAAGTGDAVPPDAPASSPLLAIAGSRTLLGPRAVRGIARSLAWLHHPVPVLAVLAAFAAFDGWLFAVHGAITPVVDVLDRPQMILPALGLSLVMMVFHELGHASACHYSGARPGRIGFGIYLIWPATYTDVTDIYRARRAGRLRTDLGGMYFNLIFILGMAGCYWLTGQPVFLAVALVNQFQILQQLVPAARLDGYFVLGDMAGIPDLFGKVGPILASMLPGHRADPRVSGLKRGSRVTVTAWVLLVVPLLAAGAGYMLWNLPRMLAAAMGAFTAGWGSAIIAFSHADIGSGLADVSAMVLLAIPSFGVAYLLAVLGWRAVTVCRRAWPSP